MRPQIQKRKLNILKKYKINIIIFHKYKVIFRKQIEKNDFIILRNKRLQKFENEIFANLKKILFIVFCFH